MEPLFKTKSAMWRLWLKIKCRLFKPCYPFSEFSKIKDFSVYSETEIYRLIQQMKIQVLSQDEHVKRVKFEDACTRYILCFNSQGQFIKKEEEVWKEF